MCVSDELTNRCVRFCVSGEVTNRCVRFYVSDNVTNRCVRFCVSDEATNRCARLCASVSDKVCDVLGACFICVSLLEMVMQINPSFYDSQRLTLLLPTTFSRSQR